MTTSLTRKETAATGTSRLVSMLESIFPCPSSEGLYAGGGLSAQDDVVV